MIGTVANFLYDNQDILSRELKRQVNAGHVLIWIQCDVSRPVILRPGSCDVLFQHQYSEAMRGIYRHFQRFQVHAGFYPEGDIAGYAASSSFLFKGYVGFLLMPSLEAGHVRQILETAQVSLQESLLAALKRHGTPGKVSLKMGVAKDVAKGVRRLLKKQTPEHADYQWCR